MTDVSVLDDERGAKAPRTNARVLYHAYHFPPIGGGGVQRNAKFVRYLHEFGYDPVVLTGPGAATDRWTPADDTLHGDVPPGTEVLRVRGPIPEISGGWRSRAEKALMRQTPFARWWNESALATVRSQAPDVDAIFGSLVPYAAAWGAAAIARELGKPWVADLQDPWALDEMWIYPTSLHRQRDLARMRRLLGMAAAVVMNTPESARRVRERFPELADRVWSITNGWDPPDLDLAAPAPRDDGKFRIVHSGYFHTDVGQRLRDTRRYRRFVGGSLGGVDIITRSPVYLLRAIDRMLAADPSLAERLEVVFAGVLSPVDRALAERSPVVRTTGYVSHHETVGLIKSADLLFLPMHDLPEGSPAGITPGKTYEYLGSGRPILAAVPDGDARELLAAAGTATLVRPKDVDGMARSIAAQMGRVRRGEPAPSLRRDVLAPFERRNLARDLAGVFDAVLSSEPANAGASLRM